MPRIRHSPALPLVALLCVTAGCQLEMREPVFFVLEPDGELSRRSANSDKPAWTRKLIDGNDPRVHVISISANRRGEIAVSFADGTIGLYRQSDGEPISTHTLSPGTIAWSNNGERLALACNSHKGDARFLLVQIFTREFETVQTIEVPSRNGMDRLLPADEAFGISWSADDRYIAVGPWRGDADTRNWWTEFVDVATGRSAVLNASNAAFIGDNRFVATRLDRDSRAIGAWTLNADMQFHLLPDEFDGCVAASWPDDGTFFIGTPPPFSPLAPGLNISARRLGTILARALTGATLLNTPRREIAIVPQ